MHTRLPAIDWEQSIFCVCWNPARSNFECPRFSAVSTEICISFTIWRDLSVRPFQTLELVHCSWSRRSLQSNGINSVGFHRMFKDTIILNRERQKGLFQETGYAMKVYETGWLNRWWRNLVLNKARKGPRLSAGDYITITRILPKSAGCWMLNDNIYKIQTLEKFERELDTSN